MTYPYETQLMAFYVEDTYGNRALLQVTQEEEDFIRSRDSRVVYTVRIGDKRDTLQMLPSIDYAHKELAQEWIRKTVGKMLQDYWESTSFERNSKRMMQARVMQKPSP
jgi:hypothetical protein